MFKDLRHRQALKNPNGSHSPSLLPIVHAKFCLGLFPYTLEGSRESPTLVFRRVGFLLTLIHVLIFFGCNISSYSKSNSIRNIFIRSDISRFFSIVVTIAGTFFMSHTFMCAIIKRQVLVKYFQKTFELDRSLRSFGFLIYFTENTKLKRTGLMVLGVLNMIIGSYCIWFFLKYDIFKYGESYIVFFMPMLYFQFSIVSFLSITLRTKHIISTLSKVS